jgi:hypothetical protein
MKTLTVILALTLALPFGPHASAAVSTQDRGPVDVELPPILSPMNVAAQLEGYAYITIALTPASPGANRIILEKMPFLQDAFLRELNKASIVNAEDAKAVDAVAVKARLLARMNQILPAGTVSALKLKQIVIALFQPQA